MGWDDIDLSGVNPNFENVPVNDYTYQVLPGAEIDQYNQLKFSLSIATEGDFNGRRLFVQLPDPSKENCGWVPKALKRLEQAVGIEQDKEAGEKLVAWMNRVGENFSKFSAPLVHRQYVNKAGDTVTQENVQLFKARPAA